MADRGTYRSIRVVLLDGPDFQRLSPDARWVFVAMKINFGPAGIEVHYPAALQHHLAAQTGLDPERVAAAMDDLAAAGWIEREGNVVWVVGQLKYEPQMSPTNAKHRGAIQRHVSGLPRLPIVARFRMAYSDYFDKCELPADTPQDSPSDSLSDSPSIAPRSTEYRIPNTEYRIPRTETETETEEQITSAKALGAGAPPDDTPDDEPTGFPEQSVSAHGGLTEVSLPERKGKERKGRDQGGAGRAERSKEDDDNDTPTFADFWQAYPPRAGSRAKKQASKAWDARLKEEHDPTAILSAAERYRNFCDTTGRTGTETVMQARTFLNDPDNFDNPWSAPPPSQNGPRAGPRYDEYDVAKIQAELI